MKVLYLIETLQIGGAEKSLLDLLPRMHGVDPIVCQIYKGDDLQEAYAAAGVRVVALDLPPKYHFRAGIRRVLDLARAEDVELIHTTLFRANVVGRVVGSLIGLPVVGSLVSECYAAIRWQGLTWRDRLKLSAVWLVDRVTARWTNHFIANSQAVKQSEAASLGIPLAKISVAHRGRDPERFATTFSRAEAESYRESLGLSASTRIILNVGRLVDSKAQCELIDAFSMVTRRIGEAVLLIAGEGPERSKLIRQVMALGLEGRVRLLGQRDDIPQLLAVADVFAFPSHYEGHPGALVEAMFAAKAIVVSDIPVHRETIRQDDTGLLVPVRHRSALAASIVTLLTDSRAAQTMGQRGQTEAYARFDVNAAARRYEVLYSDILKTNQKGRRPSAFDRVLLPASRRLSSVLKSTLFRA